MIFMRKIKKSVIGIAAALSMILSHAQTVSAVSICDMPRYQWSDISVIMSEDDQFAISDENPLEGHFTYGSSISQCFIWTDMENPTAEALGLPEEVTIGKPETCYFFGQKNSYVTTAANCYRVGVSNNTEYIDVLVNNPDIDAVVTETRNFFSTHATLCISFTTASEMELMPEDFGDMMVESVAGTGTSHLLFLSEEAAERCV